MCLYPSDGPRERFKRLFVNNSMRCKMTKVLTVIIFAFLLFAACSNTGKTSADIDMSSQDSDITADIDGKITGDNDSSVPDASAVDDAQLPDEDKDAVVAMDEDVSSVDNDVEATDTAQTDTDIAVIPDEDILKTWTQATASASFSKRWGHASVVFGGKIWVIGGFDDTSRLNDVWSSSDGAAWTQVTAKAAFSPRNAHTSVVFNDKMWVIAGEGDSGDLNDVWSSADGVKWTRATAKAAFAARKEHSSVVFGGKMWVMAGIGSDTFGDVWYSTDGAAWSRATSSAAFDVRYEAAAFVYDNKMWITGGHYYTEWDNQLADAWYSTDGSQWKCAASNSGFGQRYGHSASAYNGKMWVIAGYNSGRKNDAWYSTDGMTWTAAKPDAVFPVRSDQTSVDFNGALWVIGGFDYSGGNINYGDVWYYNGK